MATRKAAHGGKRANAGRPVTTGATANVPVRFRVSDAELADLEAEAKRLTKKLGRAVSVHQVAKRRAFPPGGAGTPGTQGKDRP